MAPQLGNYVLETATAPGTGSFTLNGPETSRRSFSAAFPNGGSVFYFADDGSSAEWGVGTLTIGTPSTLSRTTIIGTTSGGTSALNFSGSVEVYNEIPAEYVPIFEADGHLIVKSITDWTQQQALGAADAEGRYVGKAQGTLDYSPLQAGINISTGNIWLSYRNSGGTVKYAFAQQPGDYATNAAVNAEVTARVNAVAGLDAAKVNRGGDTMTGTLSTFNNPNLTSGAWNYSPAFRTYTNSRAGFQFFAQDKVGDGSTASGVLVQEWNGQQQQYWWFNPDGSITQSTKGTVAFISDIPTDIYKESFFNNDFGGSYYNGISVIHLPFGLKIVSFYVTNVGDPVRVNYPEGFSAPATSISVTCKGGINSDYSPRIDNEDSGGFTLHSRSADAVWVTAIGPK